MSDLIVIQQGSFPPLQPYKQDPEPEPSPEQNHAGSEAFQFDERLILTVPFIRYAPDGAITGFGEMAYGLVMSERLQQGGIFLGQGTPESHYFDRYELAIKDKLPNPTTLRGKLLRNLPVPCQISISIDPGSAVLRDAPTVYDVEDTELLLEFEHPGVWLITVMCVKHFAVQFKVNENG